MSRRLWISVLSATATAITVAGTLLRPVRAVKPRSDFFSPNVECKKSKVASSDGTRLQVWTYGSPKAEPIIFAHGWTSAARVWFPQVHALGNDFRVIIFDQRGHGESESGDRPFSLTLLGDDLRAVVENTIGENERALLVGHSMGGMSILSWAQHYPAEVAKKVKATVLVSTSAYSGRRRFNELFIALLKIPLPWVYFRHTWGARKVARSIALSPFAHNDGVDFCVDMALKCSVRARSEWQRVLVPMDLREGLPELTVPTTVVVGESDQLLPVGHSRSICKKLTTSGYLEEFIIIPEVGHMVSIEATNEFNSIIRSCAERHSKKETPTIEG